MDIAILGAGRLGGALARRLGDAGHPVTLAFAKTPERLAAAAAKAGARYASVENAIDRSGLVILATPWTETLALVRAHAKRLAGKIVWDTTNPLKSDLSGLAIGTSTSGGEEVAAAAPKAKVVKAVMPYAAMVQSGDFSLGEHRAGVFVCGDERDARASVIGLVHKMGAGAFDAGPLHVARYLEPLSMLLVDLAYRQGRGERFGVSLVEAPATATREAVPAS